MIKIKGIRGIVIGLPVDLHAKYLPRVLNCLMIRSQRSQSPKAIRTDNAAGVYNVHVISVTPPAFNSDELSEQLRIYYKQSNAIRSANQTKWQMDEVSCDPRYVWSIAEPFRYENASNRIAAMMSDLGQIMGATLTIGGKKLPNQLPMDTSGEYGLLQVCKGAVALIRNLFDDITVIKSSTGDVLHSDKDKAEILKTAKMVSGTLHCSSGVEVSVLVNTGTLITETNLMVVGTKGTATLIWDEAKTAFEVQRNLSHFEHSYMEPSTGLKWALSTWAKVISPKGDGEEDGQWELNTPLTTLVDYMTAESLINSQGVPLCFQSSQTKLSAMKWISESNRTVSQNLTATKLVPVSAESTPLPTPTTDVKA
eukprot:Selendium_serpulae@DN5729_c0_g1_i2.p1